MTDPAADARASVSAATSGSTATFVATLASPRPVFDGFHANVTSLVNSFRAHEVEVTIETDPEQLLEYGDLLAWSPEPPMDDDDPLIDHPVMLGQVRVSTETPDLAFRDLCAAIQVCLDIPAITRWNRSAEQPAHPDTRDVADALAPVELGEMEWCALSRGLAHDPVEILAHHDPADLTWWVWRWIRPTAPAILPEGVVYRSARGAHLSDVRAAIDAFDAETALPCDLAVELTVGGDRTSAGAGADGGAFAGAGAGAFAGAGASAGAGAGARADSDPGAGKRALLTMIKTRSSELTYEWPDGASAGGGAAEPVVHFERRDPCGFAHNLRPGQPGA